VFAVLPKKLGVEELRWIAKDLLFGDIDFDLIAERLGDEVHAQKESEEVAHEQRPHLRGAAPGRDP
jgi:hypothetical protein